MNEVVDIIHAAAPLTANGIFSVQSVDSADNDRQYGKSGGKYEAGGAEV